MNNFFFFCPCFWDKEQIWILKVYRPSLGISLSPHSAPLQVMAQCSEHSANKLLKTLLLWGSVQFSSVAQLCLTLYDPMDCSSPGLPCLSPIPGVYPNSCPLSQWCHPAISPSAVPFSSCPQSFPTSGSFQMSQLFASGGQSIEVSASTSVLPMNTQNWSPLGQTGWISLQSKGLSRVFSNTTVQKHQFFSAQLSL